MFPREEIDGTDRKLCGLIHVCLRIEFGLYCWRLMVWVWFGEEDYSLTWLKSTVPEMVGLYRGYRSN